MKVIYPPQYETKLCHARPGDVVEYMGTLCLVSYCPLPGMSRDWNPLLVDKSNGLYSIEDCITLISIESGTVINGIHPSLSALVTIYKDSETSLGKPSR